MSDTTLELTDTSGTESFLKPNLSDNECIKTYQKKTSTKLYVFIKHYIKQVKLVFQSILPDLKSFKTWQLFILIIFTIFNLTFSILVNSFL